MRLTLLSFNDFEDVNPQKNQLTCVKQITKQLFLEIL